MSPSPSPDRITVDFRRDVAPSHSWILGVDDRGPQRVELIAFESSPDASVLRNRPPSLSGARRPGSRRRPTALIAECACPEFCERDHANE